MKVLLSVYNFTSCTTFSSKSTPESYGKFMLDCERTEFGGGGGRVALKGSALEACMICTCTIILCCIHEESVLLLEQVMIFCT